MKKLLFLTPFFVLLLVAGCKKDNLNPAPAQVEKQTAKYWEDLAEDILAEDAQEVEFRGSTVVVTAPSMDELQDAVIAAGNNGTVILEEGMHYQSSKVTISNKVKITGQGDATVEFTTDETPGFPFVADAGFHVLDANQVIIENLTITDADNSGGTAILIENSDQTRVRNNTILDFELGVAQYQGNGTRVHDNTIDGQAAFGGIGVLNVVGDNTKIYDNTISDNNLDIFVGDKGGLIKSNHLGGGGAIGILLCTPNIGGAYLVLPGGAQVAADESANTWLALDNYSENHVWNYLVIDNANNNTLVNNDAANAVFVDIEMAGESDRFGFITPTTFDNLVISSSLPDVTIKVCGENNQAVGGDQVDTSLPENECD